MSRGPPTTTRPGPKPGPITYSYINNILTFIKNVKLYDDFKSRFIGKLDYKSLGEPDYFLGVMINGLKDYVICF